MANTGSNLSKNPFKLAITSSYNNGSEISGKVLVNLIARQGTDSRIADLVTYFTPLNNAYQAGVTDYYNSFLTRSAATGDIITFEEEIPVEVNAWWRMLTDVYPEGSSNYNRLWGGGNTSFYGSTRTKSLNRMGTLVTGIDTDASLATLKVRVSTFADEYSALIDAQTGDKSDVSTDTAELDNLRDAVINGLWYVYCGLNMVYLPDVAKTLAFFPMELIYKASKMRQYRMLVPAAKIRKICMRTWKTGDMVTMVNNRAIDLKVGFTTKSSITPTVWYTLPANTTVTVAPSLIGSTSSKVVMVKNEDLTATGDITFTIQEA